jgi:hypothetical protein
MHRPSLPESIPQLIWTVLLVLPITSGFVLMGFFFGSEGAPGRSWPEVFIGLWCAGVLVAFASLFVRFRRTVLTLATAVLIGSQVYGLAFQTFN